MTALAPVKSMVVFILCAVSWSSRSCVNGKSFCSLYFFQPLLSASLARKNLNTESPLTCDPVPANFRRETGPDRTGSKISRIPNRIGPDRISGRLLINSSLNGLTPNLFLFRQKCFEYVEKFLGR